MSASATTVKKVSKKTAAVAPVAEPVVAAPTPVVAPVAEPVKKTTKRSATPAAAPSAEPVVAAPTPSVTVSEPAATTESNESTLADEMKALQDQLTAIRDSATAALASLKRLGKRAATEIKEARKNRRRARSETPGDEQKKPCNFKIPVPISDELSAFLGGGKNNQMTRAQVTSAIIDYCKQRNLTEKHSINPDAPLRKLLGVDESIKLTIFNIQTYLKNHYPKPIKPTA